MSKIRLECVLNKRPRGIFVEISVDGEKLGFRNIGGDVDALLEKNWEKKRTRKGYLLWMEFEADVEKKTVPSLANKFEDVEHIYLTNIR